MKSLRVHTAQSELIQNSEDAKVDVFKAYVGALYKEGGLECVEEWLMPVVDAALNEIRMMEQKENDLADSLQDTSLDGSSGGKSASSGNPSGRTRTEPNSSKANAGNIEATLTSSLALFNQECAKKNITPEWQHAVEGPPHTPLFTATVLRKWVINKALSMTDGRMSSTPYSAGRTRADWTWKRGSEEASRTRGCLAGSWSVRINVNR